MDTTEQSPFPSLQEHLAKAFVDRVLSFEDLLNEDYSAGLWLEPEYRAALVEMERRERVVVERRRKTKTGRAPRGFQLKDLVRFPGQLPLT